MNASSFALPEALMPYEEQIRNSVRPFIRIIAHPTTELTLLQSKFGGEPYWPEEQDYPKDAQENPLYLLAQINCAELPALEGFPTNGLLQFYVANETMYGLNLDDLSDQSNFRVVYFSELDENEAIQDFSFLDTNENLPITLSYALTLEQQWAPVAPEDMAFEQIFEMSPYEFFEQFDEDVKQEYLKLAAPQGHKIGGYAHFTQEDPRFWDEEYEDYLLLLQIDSEGEGIVWGDRGIGNFFIRPSDLHNLDFSKVLYHWDNP
jgi:uncharacterized protein YwqG